MDIIEAAPGTHRSCSHLLVRVAPGTVSVAFRAQKVLGESRGAGMPSLDGAGWPGAGA